MTIQTPQKLIPVIVRVFILSAALLFSSCRSTSSFKYTKQLQHPAKLFSCEIEKYGLHDGDTLVDIGCGSGYFDAQIFSYYPKMYFILEDIDRKTDKRIDYFVSVKGKILHFSNNNTRVYGTENKIPLPDAKFRIVLCRRTMHEFTDMHGMLSEISRILSADGVLIIVELIPEFPGETDKYCKRKYLSKEEIISLATANGFSLLSAELTTFLKKGKKVRNANVIKFTKQKTTSP
jgi:ubiquinone/menaquinone biosynthesis C-methylase UbiE